jgi:hypothetical protein
MKGFKMNYGKLLAIAVIALSGSASIGYLITWDVRRAIYWAGVVIVTAAVTF